MQLSTLIDTQTAAMSVGVGIPCRDYDAELWFAERPEDVEFAKSLCGTCPARAACLAGALERSEPWGVWGGQLLVHGVDGGGRRHGHLLGEESTQGLAPASYQRLISVRSASVICVALFSGISLSTATCW